MNKLFIDNIPFCNNENVNSILVYGKESGSHPLVSVVMPIYNHPSFFEESLLSVINQKGDVDYEIIIIDNNHPEYQKENQKIVERNYGNRIRYYVNESNIGGVGSENRGISLAKGKYVTFCHDDDLLFDDALQTLIDMQRKIGSVGSAIFGNIITIDENGKEIPGYNEFNTIFLRKKKYYKVKLNDFLYRNYTNGCGSLYNRDNLIAAGGFRVDFIPCPDYALNAVYTRRYGSFAINQRTLKYRVSSLSDTSKVYKDIVNCDKRIIENILSVADGANFIRIFFVKSYLYAKQYHLYDRWGEGDKINGFGCIIARITGRIQILVSNINKSLR